MIEDLPNYRVGFKRPPLHTRFKKGQSGNPEGGRRHRHGERGLTALLEGALDARAARPTRRRTTRREAIVAALVEKSAAGDLRALKLLLDLLPKAEFDYKPPVSEAEGETARERLILAFQRIAAEDEAAAATRDESVCG
jgi:hypothetical protein